MSKAPSTLTAAVMLAVFLCFGSCKMAQASSECICFSDIGCSTQECEAGPNASCTRHVFTPAVTGSYTISAHTRCETSDCDHCRSCVHIYKIDGANEISLVNGNCHSVNCIGGSCDYSCATGGLVSLTASGSYAVYVCKRVCPNHPDNPDCEDCPDDCKAWGCFWINVMTCTP